VMDLRSQMKTADLTLKFLRGDVRHLASYPFVPQKKEQELFPDCDDLPRSTPEAEGVPSAHVREFFRALDEFEGIRIHSALVLRHGKVIAEGHWRPYGGDCPHMMFSLSKSVVSMAVGFAVQEGLLTLEDKIADIFPDRLPLIHNPRMNAVTVRHLLTMTSGVKFNEGGSVTDKDWVRAFLQSDVAFEPGAEFCYNSMNSYMLSAAVCRRTGISLTEYLTPRLFQPLGICGAVWDVCPLGVEKGGWGLWLRPVDMAKLGQLYLQKGAWGEGGQREQLLPESWVEESVLSRRPGMTEGRTNTGYGYQIWTFRAKGAFQFNGMFGQYVVVLPERDMVVAVTSGSGGFFGDRSLGFIEQYFGDAAPAFSDAPLRPDRRETAALQQMLGGLYAVSDTAPKLAPAWRSLPVLRLLPDPEEARRRDKIRSFSKAVGEKSFRLENPYGTLFPLILQCVSNNFSPPLTRVSFAFGQNACRIRFEDGGEAAELEAGLDGEPRSGKVIRNGESYAVASTARLAEDEDGRPVLKLYVCFLGTPCTREMKFIFYGKKLLIRFDETPGAKAAAQTLMDTLDAGGGLQRLLRERISVGRLTKQMSRFLLPRAKGIAEEKEKKAEAEKKPEADSGAKK
jgi:CubicO group peptidase (beta-lactamase class C family)